MTMPCGRTPEPHRSDRPRPVSATRHAAGVTGGRRVQAEADRFPGITPAGGPGPRSGREPPAEGVLALGDRRGRDVLVALVRGVRVAGTVVDRGDAQRGEAGDIRPAVLR